MWTSEKKLKARGVKFYFIIKQDVPKREHFLWQDAIAHSSPLSKYFRRVDFGYFGYSGDTAFISEWRGWNLIKVFCSDARISLRSSEVKSFYNKIFLQFLEWFIKFCRDRKVECKSYDFRILFRLHPSESHGEFVPIPSLDEVARKVVSPPSLLPNPPATPEEMFDFAKRTDVLSPEGFEVVLQQSEKAHLEAYGSYGIRTEEDANTYEFDILTPPGLPRNAELEKNLQGELCYRLILQSHEKATPDFNSIVRALLTKMLQNSVIDDKKIEHIYNNPDDYFVAIPYGTRFMLKFDLKKWDWDSELGKALDLSKKDIQRELKGTQYSLYGAIFYELTDEDLKRIEEVIEDIGYFKYTNRDELFVNLAITLVDSTYDRVIEIARKTDEILNSHKIIDLDTSPGTATDIEDAKKTVELCHIRLYKGWGKGKILCIFQTGIGGAFTGFHRCSRITVRRPS